MRTLSILLAFFLTLNGHSSQTRLAQTKPLEELLHPDGTPDLTTGFEGSVDVSGYRMVVENGGSPVKHSLQDSDWLRTGFRTSASCTNPTDLRQRHGRHPDGRGIGFSTNTQHMDTQHSTTPSHEGTKTRKEQP